MGIFKITFSKQLLKIKREKEMKFVKEINDCCSKRILSEEE